LISLSHEEFWNKCRKKAVNNEGKELGIMPISDENLASSFQSPTLQKFEAMANRGRIHMAAEDTVEPSEEDRSDARSPVDLGRLYGYSEDDIACFYLRRRGGLPDIAYEEYIYDLKSANFPPSKPSPAK
jgi:hypothetical protein